MLILGLLDMYFDAVVVFCTISSFLFRMAMAVLLGRIRLASCMCVKSQKKNFSIKTLNWISNGIFLKLLFRWKGSIYKLVWRDLVCYVLLYSLLSCIYRFMLSEKGIYSMFHIQLIKFSKLYTMYLKSQLSMFYGFPMTYHLFVKEKYVSSIKWSQTLCLNEECATSELLKMLK